MSGLRSWKLTKGTAIPTCGYCKERQAESPIYNIFFICQIQSLTRLSWDVTLCSRYTEDLCRRTVFWQLPDAAGWRINRAGWGSVVTLSHSAHQNLVLPCGACGAHQGGSKLSTGEIRQVETSRSNRHCYTGLFQKGGHSGQLSMRRKAVLSCKRNTDGFLCPQLTSPELLALKTWTQGLSALRVTTFLLRIKSHNLWSVWFLISTFPPHDLSVLVFLPYRNYGLVSQGGDWPNL